jgi:hypothetical protein
MDSLGGLNKHGSWFLALLAALVMLPLRYRSTVSERSRQISSQLEWFFYTASWATIRFSGNEPLTHLSLRRICQRLGAHSCPGCWKATQQSVPPHPKPCDMSGLPWIRNSVNATQPPR